MAQYIDKDALVAEIRSRLLPAVVPHGTHYDDWDRGAENERINILSLINTLEVKEVDLDTDFGVCWGEYCDCGGNINDYKIAKHFFELGLKAKGE